MRKILLTASSLLIMVCNTSFATSVTQSGTGADMSIATFNGLTGMGYAGTTFYFSGTFTTTLTPKISGSQGYPVTLDGWEGGTCTPVDDSMDNACPNAALLSNGTVGMYIPGGVKLSYVTIKDFRAIGGTYGYWKEGTYWDGANSVMVYFDHSDHLIFDGIYSDNSGTNGIALNGCDDCTLQNSLFHDGRSISGEQCNNFQYTNNFIVRGNRFDRTITGGTSSSGANQIEVHHTKNSLWEYNYIANAPDQGGIAFKEYWYGNENIIFRFNKVYNNRGSISWPYGQGVAFMGGPKNMYVYGNYIYNDDPENNTYLLDTADCAENIYVWSNIIKGGKEFGVGIWNRVGSYGDNNYLCTRGVKNVIIRNNTIYGNATRATGSDHILESGFSMRDTSAQDVTFQNNILSNNRPIAGSDYKGQAYWMKTSGMVSDGNVYYSTSGTPKIYANDNWRDLAYVRTLGWETNGAVEDPGLTDPGNGVFTRTGTSVNRGLKLSGTVGSVTVQGKSYSMYWDTALLPTTDWTGQPSAAKIKTADQDDYGNWERGAYIYTTGTEPYLVPPKGVSLRIIN